MADTLVQWHALIKYYGRHRSRVAPTSTPSEPGAWAVDPAVELQRTMTPPSDAAISLRGITKVFRSYRAFCCHRPVRDFVAVNDLWLHLADKQASDRPPLTDAQVGVTGEAQLHALVCDTFSLLMSNCCCCIVTP